MMRFRAQYAVSCSIRIHGRGLGTVNLDASIRNAALNLGGGGALDSCGAQCKLRTQP